MKRLIAFMIFGVLLLIGCGGSDSSQPSQPAIATATPAAQVSSGSSEDLQPTAEPTISTDVPLPAADQGTLTGYLLQENGEPFDDILVSLSQVVGSRYIYDTANSPNTSTDSNGFFVFPDLEIYDYVMVVGNVEINDYEVVANDTGQAAVFSVIGGQITDVGELTITKVSLPLEPVDGYPAPGAYPEPDS